MDKTLIPDNTIIIFKHLIQKFLARQLLVVYAMVELRPPLVRDVNIDKFLRIDLDPHINRFNALEGNVKYKGIWRQEWMFRVHGIGCELTNRNTGETLDWDVLDPFDLGYFSSHLDWRIANQRNDLEINLFLEWVKTSQISLGKALDDLLEVGLLKERQIRGQKLLRPAWLPEN